MEIVENEGARVERAAATVLAVAEASPDCAPGAAIREALAAAEARGYFTPDEDAAIHVRYTQYLAGRAALLEVLAAMEAEVGPPGPARSGRLPAFAVALLAACLLARGTRAWIAPASRSRLLRRKLDEADRAGGLPRKSFARLYRATTDPRRLRQLGEALAFYRERRGDFAARSSAAPFGDVLRRLDAELARAPEWTGGWRDRLGYRWFSIRRRHRSAWKTAVFGLFRGSGSLIAELRRPSHRPGGPREKRITAEWRAAILADVRAGDVFVTRHDDALSNLFLPGYWPHAALFVGDSGERLALGMDPRAAGWREAGPDIRFLEAKKDGVRFRPAGETLAVDQLVVLRPPLAAPDRRAALERAAGHAGKPYDFVFDFRTSDRLACTEVVYRAYHRCGRLEFALTETAGRLCLPAEELISQALEQGFSVVGAAGIDGRGWHRGRAAELAFHAARCGL